MAYYTSYDTPQQLPFPSQSNMLDNLPTELLLEILSHVTASLPSSNLPSALTPLASSSSRLYDTTRTYRIHSLNTRLAQLTNLPTLLYICPPPTFFTRHASTWQLTGGHISNPSDLTEIVEDDSCYNMLDAYISTLESITYTSYALASYLSPLLSEDHNQVMHYILHLSRAQDFYAHDVDRIWRGEGGAEGGDVITREATYGFAAGLDLGTVEGVRRVYGKLEELVSGPFSGEGEWLFRFIVREGMGAVWGRLGG